MPVLERELVLVVFMEMSLWPGRARFRFQVVTGRGGYEERATVNRLFALTKPGSQPTEAWGAILGSIGGVEAHPRRRPASSERNARGQQVRSRSSTPS